MNKRKDVIVACDFPSEAELDNFVGLFKRYEKKPFLKVGMELFYSAGPDVVRRLKGEGFDVFLDLKLHDIPNTVGRAMSVLANLGADMVNLHAAGGSEMMKRAAEGLVRHDGARPLLIAVTQLTSTSENMLKNELLINCDMETTVASYAQNAARCGLDGVVCSPLEARLVKEACGKDFLAVTPRHKICRRRKGRPSARNHTAKGERNRKRLHSGGQTDYRRREPCGGLFPLRKGIFGIGGRYERNSGLSFENRRGFSAPGAAVYLGKRHKKPHLLRQQVGFDRRGGARRG